MQRALNFILRTKEVIEDCRGHWDDQISISEKPVQQLLSKWSGGIVRLKAIGSPVVFQRIRVRDKNRKPTHSLHGIIKSPSASHKDIVDVFPPHFPPRFRQWESKISKTQVRNCSSVPTTTSKGIEQVLSLLDPLTLWIYVYPRQFNHTYLCFMFPMWESMIGDHSVFLYTHLKCYVPIYSIGDRKWDNRESLPVLQSASWLSV